MTHNQKISKHIYLLGDKEVTGAKNLQMFTIKFIPQNISLNLYDALIFTSKNALLGIDKLLYDWKQIPSYAIAPRTAEVIEKMNGNLSFVGTKKHGDEFAKELIVELKGKRALYIRGKEVVSNLASILKNNHISCDELIVYETVCKTYDFTPQIPKGSLIIFSAPSTIKCFMENGFWDDSFQAIAIGKTTAKYFPPHIKPIISDDTSLEACVEKAMEIS